MADWNFGDSFPSIEIDTDYWQKLSLKEKGQYLMRLVFQEKDLGNRINMINYIMSNSAKVGRSFIKNPEAKEYLDIIENAANLISISAAVGNIFKAKQKYKNTKNNEIAKLMGFPNGNYVDEFKLDITHAMAESFAEMSDYHKQKYGITIDNIINDDKKNGDNKEDFNIVKTMKMAGTIDGDIKWGMIIKSNGGVFEDEDTTTSTKCQVFHPVSGMKIHPDELEEKLQKVMYEMYIEKVDTRKNYVKINGTRLDICERKQIHEDITNINIPRLVHAIRRVLNEERRRGVVLVGEPGVGKTISVHKIVNNFPDRLVFWVSSDSINSTLGIRNVFKIFKMFKNSIVVFDDLDAAPLTKKDEITGEFLEQLDGTNNRDLTGFFIATVNDPSKLHMTVINRPERFDDVIHVRTPDNTDEIIKIIFNKANDRGYFTKDQAKKAGTNAIGTISFTKTNKELIEIAQMILDAKFTQVQVAGLINDCHTYTEDGCITIKLLREAVESRLKSIDTANLIAKKGRLFLDKDHISEEASASLASKRY